MSFFAHHIGVEFFGHEFSPETPMEHAVAFGVTGVVVALVVYGAYAGVRDLRRWLRQARQRRALSGR
jgi:hypothetical protein